MWAKEQNWAFPWESWLEFEKMKAESKQIELGQGTYHCRGRRVSGDTWLMEFLGLWGKAGFSDV